MPQKFLAALLLLLALPLAAQAQTDLLTVTGTGSAPIKADIARISGSAENRGTTPAEALAAQRVTVGRITAALVAAGAKAGEVGVSNFALNPQYAPGQAPPNQPRIATGYTVVTQINAAVPASANLPDLMQELVLAGLTTSPRVTYTVGDPDAAMEQARAAALKDAISKARLLAQQSGVTLGPIRMVTDSASATTALAAQNLLQTALAGLTGGQPQTSITATVTVGYAIK